jgi:nucleoid DNA-binding protein/cell division septation protein DedD
VTQPNILIWDYVKDLLHQHDCVIVPGFGGFVCNREPARIDQVSHVITPPSRKVVFNQNLKTNDGLLAEFWSQKQNVTYSQALAVIEECISSIVNTLQEKKQLSIDLFGSFRLNAEANYVFLPDKRNNYLISSFGLQAIQANPVSSRTMKMLPKAKATGRVAAGTKRKNGIWKPILAVVVSGLLVVNGYIFLNERQFPNLHSNDHNSTMNISSWFDSLFHDTTSGQSLPEKQTAEVKATENPIEYIPAPPAVVEPEITTPEETIATESPVVENIDIYAPYYAFATHFAAARPSLYFPQPPSGEHQEESVTAEPLDEPMAYSPEAVEPIATEADQGFYVIGGMFCKERNAIRFLRKLTETGYNDAQLLPSKNQHCKRVSYKRFATKAQAESFCVKIKAETNPDAWVLSLNK